MTRQQAEVADKRRYLRQEYGGLMTLKDLARELGYRDTSAAKKWAKEVQLRAIPMMKQGGRTAPKFDTDQVAKRLMERMAPIAAFD